MAVLHIGQRPLKLDLQLWSAAVGADLMLPGLGEDFVDNIISELSELLKCPDLLQVDLLILVQKHQP